jgi:hypothetical protein
MRRRQYPRLGEAGVVDRERTGWTLGPLLFAEAGLALDLRAGWLLLVSAAPTWTRQVVNDAPVSRWGAQASVGVGRAL